MKEELLNAQEKDAEKQWDQVFQNRRQDLSSRDKQSRDRRVRSAKKLQELSARWRNLESRRTQRVNDYLETMASNLSKADLHNNSNGEKQQ